MLADPAEKPSAKDRRAPPLVQRREGEVIYAVEVAPVVTVWLASIIFGISETAIRKRIARGLWLEDREWRRAPDGGIWIIVKGVTRWVEGTE